MEQLAQNDTTERFLAAAKELRPKLHRFCTRMTGSPLDGEDLVQDTLVQAYASLPVLRNTSRLEPWVFRIAHNKCLDFLRRQRGPREATVPYEDDQVSEAFPADEPIDEALAALVTVLPPMERACVLLKDVLEYRLAEIAEVVDSTLGGVKAALHRGRAKLRVARQPTPSGQIDPELRHLLDAYVECFNQRDWDGLSRLIRADARVEVVGIGETQAGTYFSNYNRLPWEWRFGLARVDGELLVVVWRRAADLWTPHSAVRLWWRDGKVARIRDYVHVDYLLRHCRTEADET